MMDDKWLLFLFIIEIIISFIIGAGVGFLYYLIMR